ncbi:MAG: glycosyltransferase family 2 protein [Microcoleus sp. SIO2G3]|nr:glycosyltransferase family 2 protein [Microcoleus sp. SIO2G3]
MSMLSWGLVIATYNREKILPECLKLAIGQTRPPSEIIVVDASAHWEETRDRVLTDIVPIAPDLRWVYEGAVQRGLTHQRNQAIKLATADVVFLIDDDSLMYPTCAEEIMRVYEADEQGLVKGVQASLTEEPPSEVTIADQRKQTGWSKDSSTSDLRRWIWQQIFLMDIRQLWIPYDDKLPKHSVPPTLADLNVYPMAMFHGCRMTFRREAIAQVLFEPLLCFYAALEDADASYRVSRQGVLLEAPEAKLHHFNSGSGRLSRYQVSALSALNQVACLKKHSTDLERDRRKFYRLMARRLLAELLKDGLSRRWSLPQVRGLLAAWRQADRIFAIPKLAIDQWYPAFQRAFLAGEAIEAPSIEPLEPTASGRTERSPAAPAKLG